jgi:hypothetical protein
MLNKQKRMLRCTIAPTVASPVMDRLLGPKRPCNDYYMIRIVRASRRNQPGAITAIAIVKFW